MTKRFLWNSSSVSSFWDAVSNSHLDKLSFAKLNGQKLYDLIRHWLPENGAVLDFGAGSGYFVNLLLNNNYKVAAFDPSEGRESALTDSVSGHSLFLGLENGLTDNQYDAVIFSEVIEHLLESDYVAVLDRVSRFVKPGGVLVVTTPSDEDIEANHICCPACKHFFHPWQHVRSFDAHKLNHEFKSRLFDKNFIGLVDFSGSAIELEYAQIVNNMQTRLQALNSNQSHYSGFFSLRALKRFISPKNSSLDNSEHFVRDLYKQLSDCQKKSNFSEVASIVSVDTKHDVDFRFGNQSTIVYVGRKRFS